MNDIFGGSDYESLFRAHDATKLRVKELWHANEVANNRIAELEAQLATAQADIARLRETLTKASTQTEHFEREWYLRGDEIETLVGKLTALTEEFQTEETWDGKRDDALRYCAGRLREAISGKGEK